MVEEEIRDIQCQTESYELNRMCERLEMEDYFGVPLNVDFTSVPGKVIITKAKVKED